MCWTTWSSSRHLGAADCRVSISDLQLWSSAPVLGIFCNRPHGASNYIGEGVALPLSSPAWESNILFKSRKWRSNSCCHSSASWKLPEGRELLPRQSRNYVWNVFVGFFFLIKKYHSHLPLPQHRFPTGWAISIRLKHMFNNKNIPCQLLEQKAWWICQCGSRLGADKSGPGWRGHGPLNKSLWPLGTDTEPLAVSHPSPSLTQSQAKHMEVSPDTCSSCCWGDLVWNTMPVLLEPKHFLSKSAVDQGQGWAPREMTPVTCCGSLAKTCNFSVLSFPWL